MFVKLDADGDERLNFQELTTFCEAVYDECNGDNVVALMVQFSQDPMTGMDFTQWCNLLSATDPDIESFTNDLYEALILGHTDQPADDGTWNFSEHGSSVDGGYDDYGDEPPPLVESPTIELEFVSNDGMQEA